MTPASTIRGSRFFLAFIIVLLFAFLAIPSVYATEHRPLQPINLAEISSESNLVFAMQGFIPADDLPHIDHLLTQTDWQPVTNSMLAAPKRFATLWLKADFVNNSDESLLRWLEIAPWRLRQVNAYYIEPDTQTILATKQSGLSTLPSQRELQTGRILFPLHLNAGEEIQVIFEIFSDSRPYLSIQSWTPLEFTASATERHIFHAIILSALTMLFIVLLCQLNLRYALLGGWLMATAILEAEKEGYITFILFESLAGFGLHLRIFASVTTGALFVFTIIYLLDLQRFKYARLIRNLVMLVLGISYLMILALDNTQLRQMVSLSNAIFMLSAIVLFAYVFINQRHQNMILLTLLCLYWMDSTYLLITYIFNINYDGLLHANRVLINIGIILAVLIIYAWHKRKRDRQLDEDLRTYEKNQRETLTEAVKVRTQELRQALLAAEQANIAKDRFLGQVSHDLRSPLNMIFGYAQLIDSEPNKVNQYSSIIRENSSHMLKLVNDLIDYAKGIPETRISIEKIDLDQFIKAIAVTAQTLAAKQNNHFHLNQDRSLLPFITSDPTRLQRILVNLLDNATKYTDQGHITLSIHYASDQQQLHFSVKDTGKGMSKESLSRLGEPFFQVDPNSDGMGLGFPIVYEMIEQLEGTLTVHSELNQGTEIQVSIPVGV
ncbi:MAG: hypothetical protein EA373_00935 [Oceanospirillales bacterium]|nr:MAG: hypothetical protein EA373_00935 [Oceanospirillales bacterium]